MFSKPALIALLTVLVLPAVAQAEGFSDPVEISGGKGVAPQMVYDEAGGATIAWENYPSMEGRRVLPGGDLTPIVELADDDNYPVLVGDRFGNAALLDRNDHIGDRGTGSIAATWIKASGAAGPATGVLPQSGGDRPQGAFDGQGRLTVTFEDYDSRNLGPGLVGAVQVGADLKAEEVTILDDRRLFAGGPVVGSADDGSTAFAWQGKRRKTRVRVVSPDGEPFSARRLPPAAYLPLQVAYGDDDGPAVLTSSVFGERSVGRYSVVGLSRTGKPGKLIGLGRKAKLAGADIAADPRGGYFATWSSSDTGTSDNSSVKILHISAGGRAKAPVRLTEPAGYAITPQVAVSSTGRPTVVWGVGDRRHGDTSAIRAMTLDRRGRAGKTVTLSEERGVYGPLVGIGPGNEPIVAWGGGSGGVLVARGR
ncbi:MAG: hypothetical protein ABIZ50_08005 [Solirubrobacterales bacterium]